MPIGTILPYTGDLNKIPHGWFLCDGTNGTPDLRDKFLQGSDVPGHFIEAGLPNITGWIGYEYNNSSLLGGAFYCKGHNVETIPGGVWGAPQAPDDKVYFDASKSNSIYGNSTTVQPPAYTVYYIIRMY